jgi:replicative DNA helicase
MRLMRVIYGRWGGVSVAEIVPRGEEFERTPPHDLAAEQCVLGGMMLSKDAISDVFDVIKAHDYYRPAHQIVHEVILDLYARGEPADAVTVAAELTKRGDISRVGGAPYLHTLIASVPTAANAGYYARIVRERAILRRLVEVGTRIVQLGYAGDGDADELVDRAEAEIYGVTDRRTSEDYLPLAEIMPGALEEIEAIGSRGGTLAGVPTGFADLDALTNGLHPGQMIVVAARPAMGKALALDTPLPTPAGWTTMGEVAVGDRLFGADGRPVTVIAATDVLLDRPCYQVEFATGDVIVADGQHLWTSWDLQTRRAYDRCRRPGSPSYPADWASWRCVPGWAAESSPQAREQARELRAAGLTPDQVAAWLGQATSASTLEWGGPSRTASPPVAVSPRTTEQIASSLRAHGRHNHAIPAARPLELPDADLPVDPYVLGCLLGAGSSARAFRTAADWEWVAEEFRSAGYPVFDRIAARSRLGVPGWLRVPGRSRAADRSRLDGGSRVPGQSTVPDIADAWQSLGLSSCSSVPDAYLRGSLLQRLALVQGLIDSSGSVDRRGAYRFITREKTLADGFAELAATLGCVAVVHRRRRWHRGGPFGHDSWNVVVPANLPLARLPGKALRARRDWLREQRGRSIVAVRRVQSQPVRCVQVDSADHLYLAGRAMIPTHNSALALDIARSASVRHGLASVLFSLEMSRNEITMRLLSAESRVPLQAMRTGQLSEDDWTKLARRMSEVVDAPLFIDDSPNMSMMEIRSKCRRLKQRHDLRLVIVDYLQLMSSPRRVENRQQEVSELSRSLKLLAKELDVPVVALAQLNRGPELRTDKRPLLADLRESGCLTARTRIVRADTNEEVALGDLVEAGDRGIPVWALDERLKYVRATMSHAFPTGRKEVFLLRLASGRQVEATGNHRFLTLDGWRALADLQRGSRIAVPRALPPPMQPKPWPDDRVLLLAHMLGDGSFARGQPIRYASVDEANLAAVTEAAKHFGVTAVRDEHPAARVVTLRLAAPFKLARGRRNPIASWLDALGLYGLRSHEKFVPSGIFQLPDDQVALFLRHIWATDGSVTVNRDGRSGRIYYGSSSRRLIDDVASLLRRFAINVRIHNVTPGPHRPQFTLDVSARDDQMTFLNKIGVHGSGGRQCDELRRILQDVRHNPNVDTIPSAIWTRVREVLAEQETSHRRFAAAVGTQFCGSSLWRYAPSRSRLATVAAVLGSAELELLATNDVLWDEIVSVESLSIQDVYDATVTGLHNFVADGISVHNSIEQDSDVVILLHREDVYERESPRAGEADLIVAKHRNGPTTTVTVAFQGHFSRFVDMARI